MEKRKERKPVMYFTPDRIKETIVTETEYRAIPTEILKQYIPKAYWHGLGLN